MFRIFPKMKTVFILFLFLSMCSGVYAQTPFIRLVQPVKTSILTSNAKQYISGATCTTCSISVNGKPVKVYATGGFAAALNLIPGDTTIQIVATLEGKSVSKSIQYKYQIPVPPQPTKVFAIESIETFPEGNLILKAGDKINFKVKAFSHCIVKAWSTIPLYEMPLSTTKGMPGIYQGSYTIQPTDSFFQSKIPITITDSAAQKITKESKYTLGVLSKLASETGITKGRLAHVEYGLGDDRLGGAKIGYVDSNIVLKISGKIGTHYRVQLTESRTAYIPEEHLVLLPKGYPEPASLTDKIIVNGDAQNDYVKIGLFAKLPYQSFQLTDPSRIVVDVFGATNNTNWITRFNTAKEIDKVDYEQIDENIFRVTIYLAHAQHWGHQLYYSGNQLVIKVRRQPETLSLKNLIICVDAGHGGTNPGGVGPSGSVEKDITLVRSKKLQQALEKEGAKVIMSRNKEMYFDNKERILFYLDSMPQLLLSIHLNSSDNPIESGGTSTYYRYIGFRNLSSFIYDHLLELGLKEYGHTGSFNFMLNSPTEYPNALIEMLFLSNPEEEAKIVDPVFQQQMVDKIIAGIKDFLNACKED